jgi:hypothetical protein
MAQNGSGRLHQHPNAKIGGVGSFAKARSDAALDASSFAKQTESVDRLLGRLQSGEINRDTYLDLRIEQAIAPLVKRLGHDQAEFMRIALRDQLESDPALIELVRRATALADAR